jgi:pyrroline-5-carboxylate reductase
MQVGFIGSHTMASALVERADRVLLAHKPGVVVDLPEKLIGPASWALVAEASTGAEICHGMPAAQAATLVTETMPATATLLTLALRRGVTSPDGSTDRGLDALERGGVRAAMDAVVRA